LPYLYFLPRRIIYKNYTVKEDVMSLITISSGIGSKADIIAKLVSQKLSLELFDNKKIEKLASAFLSDKSSLKLVDEEAPGFLQKLVFSDPEEYFNFTESIVYDIAVNGSGIIMGHAAQMILRDYDCALKVLIHAPIDDRIKEVMNGKKVNRAEAEKMIKQSDAKHKEFYKYLFKKDWESADIYDLVINTAKITPENASEIIIDMLKSDIIKECSIKTLKNMKKLSLEKRVAAVLSDNKFNIMDFKISVNEKGAANILGYINDYADAEKIKDIVNNVKGVKNIRTRLKIKIPHQGYNGYTM
jgi:cytidylate kinase